MTTTSMTAMHRLVRSVLVLAVLAALCGPAVAGETVRLKQRDGSRWRGEIGDRIEITHVEQGIEITWTCQLLEAERDYIIGEGDLAGTATRKLIPTRDIISVRTIGDEDFEKAAPDTAIGKHTTLEQTIAPDELQPAIFVLPLSGPVGKFIRHDEIEEIGEHADRFKAAGRETIIVLELETNGGSALESQFINETIEDIKGRGHRVIAWIKKAISAGCQTAMSCDEIYFHTSGTAGAVTTWNPGAGVSIKGEELRRSMEHLAAIAERNGYSKHIAYAMKTNSAMCSYDKHPETGEVTFYGDLSGEYVLSDGNSNLSFNSSNALHCGFSKGTADTGEELAELLGLSEWYETDDYGRRMMKQWRDIAERSETEIPRLFAQFEYAGRGTGDQKIVIGRQISILNELLGWLDRMGDAVKYDVPPRDQLERYRTELRKQLADIRRAERGR